MQAAGKTLLLYLFLISTLSTVFANGQEGPSADTSLARQYLRQASRQLGAGELMESLELARQSWTIAEQTATEASFLQARVIEVASLLELGQMNAFRTTLTDALQTADDLQDRLAMLDLLNLEATSHTRGLRYDSVFLTYQKCLLLAEQLDVDRYNWLSIIHNNIAIVYGELGLLDKARLYFRKGLSAAERNHDSFSQGLGNLNLARSFIEEFHPDSARVYLAAAEPFLEEDAWLQAVQENLWGRFHYLSGEMHLARLSFEKALEFFRTTGNQEDLSEGHLMLGMVFNRLEEYDSARLHLEWSLQLARAIESNELIYKAYPVLMEVYQSEGNWPTAYQYAAAYHEMRDSIFSQEINERVAKLETQFGLKQIEQENALLRAEASRQEEELRARNSIVAVFAFLLGSISLLAFSLRRTNQENKRLNANLEKIVVDRTTALNAANEEMRNSLEEMRVFAYITSHDLKEPLRNISGFTSLLERQLNGRLEGESAEYMGYIRSNAKQMHQLIDGILFYANLDHADEKPPTLPTDLRHLLDDVTVLLHAQIDRRKARIIYRDHLPTIPVSAEAVKIVLKNLIENGIKYNEAEQPTIEVSYQLSDKYHAIHVKDNGIGIEQPYQDQVFELFKRLHNRRSYEGTGLGLAICRKICQRIGAELTLQSTLGQGSIFTLQLPKQEATILTASSLK